MLLWNVPPSLDWANLSGIVRGADVGSLTTLSKKFLKGTSTVDRGRVPAPQLDSLRTGRPSRSVAFCVSILPNDGTSIPNVAQDRYPYRICVRMVAERIPGKAF